MLGFTRRVLKAFNLRLRGGRQQVAQGAGQLERNRHGGANSEEGF